jgi:thioredoxin reductase
LQKSKSLFIIGDAQNDMYRQTAIATGDGIKTAMEIYRKLNEENS